MTSKFKKEFIIYSISVGIDRGGMLLYLPLLSAILGVEGYGNYNYLQVLTRFLLPFLCLNISSGIIKTGAENIKRGMFLCRNFSMFTFAITSLFALVVYLFVDGTENYIYFYVVVFAGVEALQSIILSYLRTTERNMSYFLFVALKTLIFIVFLSIFKSNYELSLYTILRVQIFITFCLFVYFFFTSKSKIEKFPVKPILIFSLFLIPHGIAQWAIAASGRILLKHFCNDLLLGYFGIFFTLGSVALLVNSGIAIVLPQHMIQNYEKWKDTAVVKKFILQYSVVVFLLFAAVLVWLFVDKYYFFYFDIFNKGILHNFVVIYTGFYVLGFYYYYSNVLFCLGKSQTIMWTTVATAAISIPVSIILIYYFDLIGASISLLVSYMIYSILIAHRASKHEKAITKTFIPLSKIMIVTCAIFFMTFYLFLHVFSV